jgi:hypothetical protein
MLIQSSQRTGALRKLIAPLLIICLSVLGLSAQADGNTRAPIVSAATSIQGCNEGLIMLQGQYKCRSILYVREGGLIPDPVVVAYWENGGGGTSGHGGNGSGAVSSCGGGCGGWTDGSGNAITDGQGNSISSGSEATSRGGDD